jgi:hypothetical protein
MKEKDGSMMPILNEVLALLISICTILVPVMMIII